MFIAQGQVTPKRIVWSELVRDFIYVLFTCKIEEEPKSNFI